MIEISAFTQIAFDYLMIALRIYEYVLFLYILASWFGGLPKGTIGDFVRDLVRPILKICKQVPHTVGPVDISPIYAFILIGIIRYFLIVFFTPLLGA